MADRDDSTHLMAETRRLLNALNEENGELKKRNHHLSEGIRDAKDDVVEERRRFAALEADSKQLNLNIMQQLHAKGQDLDAASTRAAKAEAELSQRRSEAAASQEDANKLRADALGLREENVSLHDRLRSLKRELDEARAEASKQAEGLQHTIDDGRDRTVQDAREHNVLLTQLRQEAARAETHASAAKEQFAASEAEVQRLQAAHQAEITKLRWDASRTQQVESESAYAHDQMHAMATAAHAQLEHLQATVRTLARDAETNDALLAAVQLQHAEEEMRLRNLATVDDALIESLQSSIAQLRTQLDDARRGTSAAEAKEASGTSAVLQARAHAQSLEQQLTNALADHARSQADANDLRRQLSVLKAQRETSVSEAEEARDVSGTLRMELQEAQAAATKARDQLASSDKFATEERGRLMARVHELEKTVDQQAGQLHEVHDTLERERMASAAEVHRLESELQLHSAHLAQELTRLQSVADASRQRSLSGGPAPSAYHAAHASHHQQGGTGTGFPAGAVATPPVHHAARAPTASVPSSYHAVADTASPNASPVREAPSVPRTEDRSVASVEPAPHPLTANIISALVGQQGRRQ